MDKEVAKLFLNGSSLSTTQNALGVRTADYRTLTFNVDMRNVLGETLWTKYDKYKAYIWEQSNTGGTTVLLTCFVSGINLIQASFQGQEPGGQYAISQNQNATNPLSIGFIDKPGNCREFVMIKPNANFVPLTFNYVNDDGTTGALSTPVFMLTFVPYEENKIYRNPFNYLYQNEQANFTLTTQILTAGGTNAFGTCDANYNNFTFTNLNMRQIIGTLWDKYDKFNLYMRNIGIGQTATVFSGNQRRMFFLISGLQFINAVSQTSSIRQDQVATPMFVPGATSQADASYWDAPTGLVSFRKPESENVSLTFQQWTISSGIPVTSAMNNFSFSFSVVGIKE